MRLSERSTQVNTVVLFLEALAHFSANRLGRLLGYGSQAGDQAVAHAERADHHAERLGQLLFQLEQALGALTPDVKKGQRKKARGEKQRRECRSESQI